MTTSIRIIKLSRPPKTQKELNRIKREFLARDIIYKGYLPEDIEIDLDKSTIGLEVVTGVSISVVKDEFGFDDEVEVENIDFLEIDFKNEFQKALDLIFEDYRNKFITEIDRKGVFSKNSIEGFKKFKLAKINDLTVYFKEESDVEEVIKKMILEFLDNLYEYISNFNIEEIQVSDKLKFKLTRNEVILLFQTMLNKGVISGISPNDLYRMLENYTCYQDKDGNYSELKGARIQANKFDNGHAAKGPSLKILGEIFDNTFFTSER